MIKKISTSRRKILLFIAAAVFAVALLFCLTACASDGLTEDDVKGMGFDVTVVFDYNGGNVNDQTTQKIFLQKNSKVPNLTEPNRTNYSFRYFVTAKLGDNGEAQRDEGGNIVIDKVWDFATDVPSGDTTLYAVWWDNYKIKLHYGENFEKTVESSVYRDKAGEPNPLYSTHFNVSGYTVIDYFYDSTFNQRIESVPMKVDSEMFEKSTDKLTLDVYCNALEGVYTIWRDASDVKAFSETTNIYLYRDITMADKDPAITFPDKYTGKFLGNNHTISNLKVNTSSSGISDSYYGMFKVLGNVTEKDPADESKTIIVDAASVTDVTFENVSLSISLMSSIQQANIALFVGQISSGVTVKNVKVSGSLNYDITIGFTNTDAIHVHDFYAIDRGDNTVTGSGVQGNVSVTGADVVYTEDESRAVYVKGAMINGEVVPESITGVAEKRVGDDGTVTYNQIRFTRFVKNKSGVLVYTGSSSRVTAKISVTNDGNGGYIATYSSAVIADATNKFRVYLDAHTDNNETVIDGVYDMQALNDNGNVIEGSVTSIVANDDGSYLITLDGVTYKVTIQKVNNNYAATVEAA